MSDLQLTHDLFSSMTKREMQIIRELAEGLSTKEIAGKLEITMATVEAHRHNIMKKTRCKNTAHIVATFIRQKVIA